LFPGEPLDLAVCREVRINEREDRAGTLLAEAQCGFEVAGKTYKAAMAANKQH
jgi:hypothetical protein